MCEVMGFGQVRAFFVGLLNCRSKFSFAIVTRRVFSIVHHLNQMHISRVISIIPWPHIYRRKDTLQQLLSQGDTDRPNCNTYTNQPTTTQQRVINGGHGNILTRFPQTKVTVPESESSLSSLSL